MTVFLLVVVFTMLVFLLISLPRQKAGCEAPADQNQLPGVVDGTAGASGPRHRHSSDGGQSGNAV